MDFWSILGIEKTKNIEVINDAYRQKLRLVNPEEKPQEFMQLRAEYEDALSYAREEEKDQKDCSPIGIWIGEVGKVYNELFRRTDPEEWKDLLSDSVCVSLDSRIEARNRLIEFTADNYNLPQAIWQLLDDEFSFKDNKEELYEIFPKGLIDNVVINRINNDVIVPFEMFAPDTKGNPDVYFNLYFKADNEISNGDFENAEMTLDDIARSGISHPFTRLLEARLANAREDRHTSLSIIDELVKEYPGEIDFLIFRADLYRALESYEQAMADYENILSLMSAHCGAIFGLSRCLMELGSLVQSKEKLIELLDIIPNDRYVTQCMDVVNDRLKEFYEPGFTAGELDFKDTLEYGWCCLQTEEYDKAMQIISEITPSGTPQTADYENFLSKLFLYEGNAQESLKHLNEWLKAVEELPDGKTEEEKKRKDKKCEILNLQSRALLVLNRIDESLEKAELAHLEKPDTGGPLETICRIYYSLHEYEKAADYAQNIIECAPDLTVGHYLLALCQFELGLSQQSYDNFGEALKRDRSDLSIYIFRARILLDNEQWDAAKDIIDYLEERKVEHDSLRFCKARLTQGNGDKETALSEYYAIIENYESGESDVGFMWDVYYTAADLEYKNKEPDEIIIMLDKGLALKDDYYPLLNYKAFILKRLDRNEEAVEVYKRILELYPFNRRANENIGDIYYDLFEYKTAVEYYEKQLATGETTQVHKMIGLCLMYEKEYDQAEQHFLRALELDPDSLGSRTNLGLMYERRFEFERSLELQRQCVEINEKNGNEEQFVYRRLAYALARMGRHNEAIDAYRKNIELFNHPDDYLKIAQLYMESLQLDKAKIALDKWREQSQEDAYYLYRADIKRLEGDDNGYIEDLELIPDDNEHKQLKLASYWMDNEEYSKSLGFFDKYGELLEQDNFHGLVSWSKCLKKAGKTKEAEEKLNAAFERTEMIAKEKYREALYLTKMAFALIAAGRYDEAKVYFDEALSAPLCNHCKYGKCKDAYLAMGEYYEELGEYQKAIEACEKGLKVALDEVDFTLMIERFKRKIDQKI